MSSLSAYSYVLQDHRSTHSRKASVAAAFAKRQSRRALRRIGKAEIHFGWVGGSPCETLPPDESPEPAVVFSKPSYDDELEAWVFSVGTTAATEASDATVAANDAGFYDSAVACLYASDACRGKGTTLAHLQGSPFHVTRRP